jgi:nucleoid-associated protein YgaU
MAFNPLVAVVGLAVAGVAVAAAVTWDRWGGLPAPAEVAQGVTPPPAPAVPQPQQQTAAVEPKAGQPAAAPQPAAPAATETAPVATETAPAAPPATDSAPQPSQPEPPAFDIVRVEPDGSALVAGRAAPNATVTIVSGGKPLGEARANERGEWVWTSPAPLAPGSYAVTLEAAPEGGGAPAVSEQAVAVVVPDRPETPLVVLTAPDQPSTVIQKPEAKVASVTQQPEAALEQPAANRAVPAAASVSLDSVDYNDRGDMVFTGRGTPGETVRLYVDNAPAGEALVGADGRWTWSGEGAIAPGRHTLRADQIGAGARVTSRVELPFMREAPQAVAAAAAAPAPEPAEPAAAAPAPQQPGRIVIQPGNNLWNISRVLYGKGTQYTVIYEANRDQIRDPSRIYPGQIFQTPGTTAPSVIDPAWRKPLSEITGQPQD